MWFVFYSRWGKNKPINKKNMWENSNLGFAIITSCCRSGELYATLFAVNCREGDSLWQIITVPVCLHAQLWYNKLLYMSTKWVKSVSIIYW